MKSPCADSRHNRFGISQCYCEAVAHRHGHSYRTVFVLDLNDPCLGIRHADEMSLYNLGTLPSGSSFLAVVIGTTSLMLPC